MSAPSIAKQQLVDNPIVLPRGRQLVTRGIVGNNNQWPQLYLRETSSDIVRSCYEHVASHLNEPTSQAAWVRCRLPRRLFDRNHRVTLVNLVNCESFDKQVGTFSVQQSADGSCYEICFHRRKFCGEACAPEPVRVMTIHRGREMSRRLRNHH